jgi:hypothetical protein
MLTNNTDKTAYYSNLARVAMRFYLANGNPAELVATYVYSRKAFRYAARQITEAQFSELQTNARVSASIVQDYRTQLRVRYGQCITRHGD